MQENAWDLGGGGESFQFDRVGDEVEGFITDAVTRQGTDMQTDKLEWWDEEHTRPKMITLITLQTAIRDSPKDSGLRTITLAGSKKPNTDGTKSRMCAARNAVLAVTGGTAMEPGAWFKMRFTSEGAKTRVGFNAPKYFEAWYRSPVLDLDGQSHTAPANQVSDPWSVNPTTTNYTSNAVNTTTGEILQPGVTLAGKDLTAAQVEGVRALAGQDPAAQATMLATVFGANWADRVAG